MTPAITTPFGDIPKIKELLKKHPKGLNITEISSALHLHRNTSAKYLDMLKLKGDVDRKQIGTAKNYMLVQRMPVAALIRFSLHPAFILDARMEVVMVTGDALDLFGCPLEVLYGEEVSNLPFALFKETEIQHRCHDAVQGIPAIIPAETTLRGIPHQLRVHFIPVVFDTGKDGCALVVIDDTRCREAARELDLFRQRYDALTSGQSEYLVHAQADFTISFVNNAFCRRTGRVADHLIGFPFLHSFPADSRREVRNALDTLAPGQPSRVVDVRIVRPDGTLAWEQWTLQGIYDAGGALRECHATGRDVTDLRHCEEQLERYHRNLETLIEERTTEMQEANRALMMAIAEKEELERELLFTQFAFDHASDSILLFDAPGNVYKANRTASELLGYSPEEIRSIDVFDVNPSISSAQWRRMWADAYPGKKERTVSIHKKKDGTLFDVEVSRTFVQFGDQMFFCSIAREYREGRGLKHEERK